MLKPILFCLCLINFSRCAYAPGTPTTKVFFQLRSAYNWTVLLEKISVDGKPNSLIDSIVVKEKLPLAFVIKDAYNQLYSLRVKGSPLSIMLVNDAPVIKISANLVTPNNYMIDGSEASSQILSLNREMQKAVHQNDGFLSMTSKNTQEERLQWIAKRQQEMALKTALGTRNAAVFLYAYNYLDFGKDHSKLKEFILRESQRFPDDAGVQSLKKRTLRYLALFENPFAVGSVLPLISLPDLYGNKRTIQFNKPYTLLTFWSSWCASCLANMNQYRSLNQQYSQSLQLINIAVDKEKEECLKLVRQMQMPGLQLIDSLMWEGTAASSYKIDSLPFNFLVDANGKVLERSISPDSIFMRVSERIH